MDQFIAALPLIVSTIVPPLFAAVRGFFLAKLPAKWIPVLLPIAGGIVGAVAHLLGVDSSALADYEAVDASAWQTVITGIMSGLASNGIHQIYKQQKKEPVSE